MKRRQCTQDQVKRRDSMTKDVARFQELILQATERIGQLERQEKVLGTQELNERKRTEALIVSQKSQEAFAEAKEVEMRDCLFQLGACTGRLRRVTGAEDNKDELRRKQVKIHQLRNILHDKMDCWKCYQIRMTHAQVRGSR